MEKIEEIANKNWLFFISTIGSTIHNNQEFIAHVIYSINEPVQYKIPFTLNPGCVLIDSTKIQGDFIEDFFEKILKLQILNQVALEICSNIQDNLASEVIIVIENYRFHFRICEYRNENKLSRLVKLNISNITSSKSMPKKLPETQK